MGNSNWMQILFIVLVFGGGAIQWAWRKLSEQRAIHQAKAEAERLEMERLRTGRVAEPAKAAEAQTASVDLESIAARRQRQLEELRRRQQAAKRPAGAAPPRPQRPSTQAGTPKVQRPTSGGPATAKHSQPAHRSLPSKQPSARPRTAIDVSDIDGLPEKQFKALATTIDRHQADHELSEFAERFQKERREDTAEAGRAASARALAFRSDIPKTRAEWRRAIIASEILAKPLSERNPDQ